MLEGCSQDAQLRNFYLFSKFFTSFVIKNDWAYLQNTWTNISRGFYDDKFSSRTYLLLLEKYKSIQNRPFFQKFRIYSRPHLQLNNHYILQ